MFASMGTPRTRFAIATPHSSAGTALPTKMPQSQSRRQRGLLSLLRNSNATPRIISATSMSSSARKKPLNSVAYQLGNAANIAPPAVMSQTSLPSQNGPMVLMMTRRSSSFLPRNGSRIPTP